MTNFILPTTARRTRILLVDDQPDMRKLLRLALECYDDISVVECADGSAAWLEAQLLKPELMVVDVMMPGLNGYELCEMVKHSAVLQDTKVIMCSARAQREDVERGHKAGCDAYLTKPFSPIVFLNTVDLLLDRVH